MLKQLKYDFSKLLYQKKYLFIFFMAFIYGIILSVWISQKVMSATAVVAYGFSITRPAYWLLCCYTICDIMTNDYHYKTIKNVLPYAKGRARYIISKAVVSASVCIVILLLYYIAANAAAMALNAEHEWIFSLQALGLLCIGAMACIFVLESFITFCIVITESEAAVIGVSMSFVIIMVILELIETLAPYLPTMWLISLPVVLNTGTYAGQLIISLILICSLMLSTGAIWAFKKKDLFL